MSFKKDAEGCYNVDGASKEETDQNIKDAIDDYLLRNETTEQRENVLAWWNKVDAFLDRHPIVKKIMTHIPHQFVD